MTDLTELLARVEAATGPDRELDFDLERLKLTGDGWFREDRAAHLRDPRWCRPEADGRTFVHGVAYRYTASLDAALALCERVLPGWNTNSGWLRDPDQHGEPVPRGRAYLWFRGREFAEEAPTPALALILAMLRALAAKET